MRKCLVEHIIHGSSYKSVLYSTVPAHKIREKCAMVVVKIPKEF